jgi:hypothetical protein
LLLTSQRNAVFSAIHRAGLDPALFKWAEKPPRLIYHPNQAYFFKFEASYPFRPLRFWWGSLPLRNRVAYFPADADGHPANIWAVTWADKFKAFKVWIELMTNEAQADLWSGLEQRDAFLGGAAPSQAENALFSEDEQRLIQDQIDEAKRYIRAVHATTLDDAQVEAIEAQLDYLVEATARMGRIDWKNALTGALLGLVLGNVVSYEPVRDLIAMLSRGIGHLFGIPSVLSLGP